MELKYTPTSEPSINTFQDSSHKTEPTKETKKDEDSSLLKSAELVVINESPKELTEDPTILKYRKMLQFGVPRGAVELKMVNEGIDPKFL